MSEPERPSPPPEPPKFLPPPPVYIGDSVYVRYEGSRLTLRLYLDNGMGPHSEIVLEHEHLEALDAYRKVLRDRVEAFMESKAEYEAEHEL